MYEIDNVYVWYIIIYHHWKVELGSPEPGPDTKVTVLGGDGAELNWKVSYLQ